MGLPKGRTNNPNGRPAGLVIKMSRDLRKSITEFLEKHFDEVVATWEKLSDQDKVKFYRDLLQYAVPRLQSTQLRTEYDLLTDEQLDHIIDELKKAAYEQITKD